MSSAPTPIPVPEGLRGLDPAAVAALRDVRIELERLSGLGERTIELVRLGTLVALGAPPDAFASHVARAVEGGVAAQEIWGVVLAVAPLVGVPRLVSSVPAIRAALDA